MATRAHRVPKFYLGGFVELHTAAGQAPALWVFDQARKQLRRRSPKNVSTVAGYYDGRRGLPADGGTTEQRLAHVESDAAPALGSWSALPTGGRREIPPALSRFIAWLAARTQPMGSLLERMA